MKKVVVVLAALVGVLATAPAASAAKPPIGVCPDEPPSSQPFLAYGDDDSYFLAPGGDFEGGAPGWTLGDGAALVASPAGTGTSLSLAPGTSATSPPICVSRAHLSARLFGQAIDGPRRDRSRLDVDVISPLGLVTQDRNVRVGEEWQPTRQFRLGAGLFELDPTTLTTEIQLRFTADGPAAAVLDDLWIDPSARR